MLTADGDPSDLDEARGFNDWEKWLEAHNKEWFDLDERKAIEWCEVDEIPEGEEIIDSLEVFKTKRCKDGGILKHQVRVVAKGFQQTQNVSFAETFSPTAQPVSVRMLVSISVANGYDLATADVSTTYLNAPLEKPVYMRPLKGVKDPENRGRLIQVLRSLYGLKISAKNWHRKFVQKIKAFAGTAVDIKCVTVTSDKCMFRFTKGNSVLIILIVVDDVLSATNDNEFSRSFLDFNLKDHKPSCTLMESNFSVDESDLD
eukprot:3934290-Rhodomonas_salina.1